MTSVRMRWWGMTVNDEPQPNLGCATTAELIEELAARARVSARLGEDWPLYRSIDDH